MSIEVSYLFTDKQTAITEKTHCHSVEGCSGSKRAIFFLKSSILKAPVKEPKAFINLNESAVSVGD